MPISYKPSRQSDLVVAYDHIKKKPIFCCKSGEESISESNFIPLYMPNQRFTALIIGNAGSGKTTLVKNMVKTLQSMIELPAFLVTPLEQVDPSFRGAKLKPLNPSKAIETDKAGNDKFNSDMKEYRKMKIAYKHKKSELEPEQRMKLEAEIEDMKPERSEYDFSTKRVYTPIFKQLIKNPCLLVFEDADSLKGNRSAAELLTESIVHGRHDCINLAIVLHRPVRNSTLTANIHECDMVCLLTANKLNLRFLSDNFGEHLVPIFKDLLRHNRYVCYLRSPNIVVAENMVMQL